MVPSATPQEHKRVGLMALCVGLVLCVGIALAALLLSAAPDKPKPIPNSNVALSQSDVLAFAQQPLLYGTIQKQGYTLLGAVAQKDRSMLVIYTKSPQAPTRANSLCWIVRGRLMADLPSPQFAGVEAAVSQRADGNYVVIQSGKLAAC